MENRNIKTLILESINMEEKAEMESYLETVSEQGMIWITQYVEGAEEDGLLHDLTLDDIKETAEGFFPDEHDGYDYDGIDMNTPLDGGWNE